MAMSETLTLNFQELWGGDELFFYGNIYSEL